MSPDARLIAAAIRMGTGTSFSIAASDVVLLEEQLAKRFPDHDRGIRGMVPVALVKDWLTGIRGRAEALPFNAEHLPQLGDLLEHLGKIRAQLEAL